MKNLYLTFEIVLWEDVIFFNASGVEKLNQPITMDVTMDIRPGCLWYHIFVSEIQNS